MEQAGTFPNGLLRNGVIFSVVIHGVIIASSFGLISLQPQYGVTQAPASVEVQLVEENPEPIPQIKTEEVLTAVPESETFEVIKKEEAKPVPEIKKQKTAPLVSQTGATHQEAKAYLENPAPVYPEKARLRGWEGLVVLDVTVSEIGRVTQVDLQVSAGHKVLDEAAIKAVKGWRFKPAGLGDVTFTSTIRIPVRFRLTDYYQTSD